MNQITQKINKIGYNQWRNFANWQLGKFNSCMLEMPICSKCPFYMLEMHARNAHFTKAYFTIKHIIQNADFVTRVQTVSELTLHEPPLRNLIEEKYAFFLQISINNHHFCFKKSNKIKNNFD